MWLTAGSEVFTGGLPSPKFHKYDTIGPDELRLSLPLKKTAVPGTAHAKQGFHVKAATV